MRVLLETECPGEEILFPKRRLERAKRVFEEWASATMSEYFNVKVRVLADSDGDVYDEEFREWLRSEGVDADSRYAVRLNLPLVRKYAERAREKGAAALLVLRMRCGGGVTYRYYAIALLEPRPDAPKAPPSWLALLAAMKHPRYRAAVIDV
jgi:hypothetical protein